MIKNANERINGKPDKNKTANPIITENALIVIPLPMVIKVFLIASG